MTSSSPAGGTFTVELASNQGMTSLSFDGERINVFGDGEAHPQYEGEVRE